MRVRLLSSMVVFLLLAACAGESVTVDSPTGTPLPMGEVTLEPCVIAQGETPPTPATGEEFTTIEQGVLTVGSDVAYPPFESFEGDKPVGFDIDLITEVAKRSGNLRVNVINTSFEGIFQALATGRFDVVISAVTIKEDRKQTVDFSDPYFNADQSLAIRTTDAGTISGVEDLEGRTVGVQVGTTGEDCANNAIKETYGLREVRSYDTFVDAFNDLAANRVDAVVGDLPTANQIAEERTGFSVVQRIRTQEEYGIAVSKQNPNLREAINRALAAMREDGTYDRIFQEWFGTAPPAE
ncbi:MAG TPA: basic amino acid ABC transporter substrate-binding protein [Actinomycetota bacterium]|nr:basic amino acid ABC transporter substrate-binding protein [Actinomycetota bacterium]